MGLLEWLVIKTFSWYLQRITLQEGSYNTLWAATSQGEGLKSEGIYEPVGKVVKRTKLSEDEVLENKLWDWTERQLEAFD